MTTRKQYLFFTQREKLHQYFFIWFVMSSSISIHVGSRGLYPWDNFINFVVITKKEKKRKKKKEEEEGEEEDRLR